MRILIDECVDPRVSRLFAGHHTATVHAMGWDACQDGALLKLAQDHFDVLVTIDKGIEFQQKLALFSIALIIVTVPKLPDWPLRDRRYETMKPELLYAIENATPGTAVHVAAA